MLDESSPGLLEAADPEFDPIDVSDDASNPEAPSHALSSTGLKLGLAGLGATTLTACGGSDGGGGGTSFVPSVTPPVAITQAQAARFLLQAQFSANDTDMNAVIAQGYATWLSNQYATPQGQNAADWLNSKGYNVVDATNRYFFNSTIGDNAAWNQLMASPDQVRKRLTLALSEMMVVSLVGLTNEVWPAYLEAYYWDTLAANVFGNFRTLLGAVTLNPGMGYYLGTRGNLKENAQGRQPDENYAREVQQLFTIGLFVLNTDGSPQLDLSGNKQATYSQSDITNLAHVFTGWDLDTSGLTIQKVVDPANSARVYQAYDPVYAGRPMIMNAANHSTLSVSFLGTTLAANMDPTAELNAALDALFNHPNVGPFFAKQMIQRLVTSNPSPGFVQRVANIFNNNGAGVRGDLKSVWTAILTDVEATTPATSATGGKLREPILRLTQLARTLNVTSTSGSWKLGDMSDPGTGLGQSPWRSPSVFNFFRPGFVPPSTALTSAGLTAPEFQLVNESTVAAYINVLANFLASGLGTSNDLLLDFSGLQSLVTDTQGLLTWLNLRLSANQVSAATLATIKTALDSQNVTSASTSQAKNGLIASAIYLMMSCPEYLIQK